MRPISDELYKKLVKASKKMNKLFLFFIALYLAVKIGKTVSIESFKYYLILSE